MDTIPKATIIFSGVAPISKGSEITILEGIQEGNNFEATLIHEPYKNITYESETRNLFRVKKPASLITHVNKDKKETNCTVESVRIIGGKTTYLEVEFFTAKDLFR